MTPPARAENTAMKIEQVIDAYQSSLRAFLMSRLGNRADVDDVLQEVLIKTFRNLHRLEADDKLKPWLFQIAQNALMDHYRRAKRDGSVMAEDLWYDSAPQPEHAFETCVAAFLDALPDGAAALLKDIELSGVSQKDYAARLGISYSTLKSRVQASRKKLRALFEDCCDIEFAADGSVLDYRRKSDSCGDC